MRLISRQPSCRCIEKGFAMKSIQQFIQDEAGVTAIEYSLIAALIAVVIAASVTNVQVAISNAFAAVVSAI